MPDYKAHLTKLHHHLNILREREAKHGSEPPLTLLNQIDDHQQAIALTEQAIAGQLSQAQWREALKPMLISLNLFGDFFTTLPLQRPPRAEHFTGREKELTQLLADLQPGRVVTLCGPGGIGKTALAAQALWTLAPGDTPPDRFPDGLIFHSFYNQPQADLALEAIARAFGEEPKPTPRDAAQRVLANRQALLVLDGAEAADDLPTVLDIRGNCGVLVTSRQRKDATAERQDIAPLPLDEAVTLLQAWGGNRATDHAAAHQICELVGGLPLAVRLAGRYLAQQEEEATDYLAWLQETPLTALDQGQRQRDSVPLLLDRSLAQVSERAQQALAVVGLLALAPFSREVVAEALALKPARAGRLLGELVNYGLLLRPSKIQNRYATSHPLIHTYAHRRLATSPEILALLATHYAKLAEEQSKLGPGGYTRLDVERAHMMAVLDRCVEWEEWAAGRSLAWAVQDYLDLQGHWTERVAAIEAGLTATRALDHRRDEGAFLGNLGNAYSALGQVVQAIEYYEQALAIARQIGGRRDIINGLGSLGNAYLDLEQIEQAIEYYKQALIVCREFGYRQSEGACLGNLGRAYRAMGQIEQTIEYYEQALIISREIGDRRSEGNHLGNLGRVYLELGQAEQAIECHEQALVISREIGDRRSEGLDLSYLGNVYSATGQIKRAIEYYEQALIISREIGDRRSEGVDLGVLGHAYYSLRQMELAIKFLEQALEISHEIGDRESEGKRLGNLGLAYSALGQVEKARQCLTQALIIFEEINSPYVKQARRDLVQLEAL